MSQDSPTAARSSRPSNVRNVLTNWGSLAFTAGLNFFLSPFIVRSLGAEQYGLWSLLGSMIGYMWLIDLGVRSAVTRYVARKHAQRDDEEASNIVSAASVAFLGLAAVVLLVGCSLSFVIGDAFSLPPHLLPAARTVLVVASFTVAIGLLTGVYGGVLAGLQRFDLLAANQIIGEVIRATGLLIMLSSGQGIVGMALVHLTMAIYLIAAQRYLAHRLYPQLRISVRRADRAHLRSVFSFSVFSTFLFISTTLVQSADPVIIGAFLPVTMITFFAIGSGLLGYVRPISRAIIQTVGPRVAALEASGTASDIHEVVLQTGRLSTLVVLPVTITLMIRGTSFIGLWMGPQYAELAGRVLLVLAIALSFTAARLVLQSSFVGLARHRHLVPYYVSELLINVALSVYLIQDFGIVGEAWGTTIPSVVASCAVVPMVTRRIIGIPFGRMWLEFWIRPTVAMLPFAAGTAGIEYLWPARSLTGFLAQVALVLPLAALGAWFIAFAPAERKRHADAYLRPLRAALTRAS